MPARCDINPADIPALLPYLMIAGKINGQFRWRLVGTAAVRAIGRDPTGSIVGSYYGTPETAAAARAIHERVFTTARPVFATGELKSGAVTNMSLLTLPLSDDGTNVNLAVSTLIACFNLRVTDSTGWVRVKVHDVIEIDSAGELEKRCLDWERYCDDQRRRAEGIALDTR
jgi:hypothetical protein